MIKRPWRSGFCSVGMPDDSHARCDQHPRADGTPCSCFCHWKADPLTEPDETPVVISEPGIYYDLSAEDYHRQHDWLSWSRMKHLIPPSTPAHFKASLKAGEERKRHLEFGTIVHKLVLGEGDDFVVVQAKNKQREEYDALDYTTVSAKAHRDSIYAEGKIPVLRHELDEAELMAAAVRDHKIANALLTNGRPEVSLFWVDPDTGVKCRARLDWLPDPVDGRRLIVPDLKTAADASPIGFAKAAANNGYYGQAIHYSDGIRVLGLHPDPAFLFVVVEKADPWLVQVGQFADKDDLKLARAVVDHTRRLYAECTATDNWPGYPPGINDLTLPNWLAYNLEEALA